MDSTMLAVSRLWEQGYSRREIAEKLGIGEKKVQKILVTLGAVETVEAALLRSGMTVAEIAAQLGKSENAVLDRIPYSKGIYGAEYPTKNAIRIRKCREK